MRCWNYGVARGLGVVGLVLVVCAVVLTSTTAFSGHARASAVPAVQAAVTFPHGVAAGEVTHHSAVLWTRLDQPAPVTLEVARDPGFGPPVLTRALIASAQGDFTVKAALEDLAPDRQYFYRFRSANSTSDTGTFRSAPAPGQTRSFRFAWTGDSDGTRVNGVPGFNNFETLDAARREGLDFFVYLGDTIYADSAKRGTPASTLAEYRDAYKLNRDYVNLRNLLQATSTYAQWDDHEFRDDFPGQIGNVYSPTLYTAGRQAFLEYLPVSEAGLPRDPNCAGDPHFRTFSWGKDVDLFLLDERSCRSPKLDDFRSPNPAICNGDLAPTLPAAVRANPSFAAFFPNPPSPGCLAAINDPSRTMLGARQKELFKDALRKSNAKFKFVLSEDVIQQYYTNPYDRWEGYGAERTEILRFIRDNNIQNVIFLSTDDHFNVINEVFIDRFTDPTPIAWEFVTGPVAYFTDQQLILGAFGPTLGPIAVAAKQQILSLVGVDCRNLDVYSYGVVDVNVAAGTVGITLKDATGAVVRDQLNSTITCTKTIGP